MIAVERIADIDGIDGDGAADAANGLSRQRATCFSSGTPRGRIAALGEEAASGSGGITATRSPAPSVAPGARS